jgi:hypothetical protein
MHIASALSIVRRAPVQSDAPAPQTRVRFLAPRPATKATWRAALPGAILLTVLALLGGLFPILF